MTAMTGRLSLIGPMILAKQSEDVGRFTTFVDPSYNECKMPHQGDELLAHSRLHNVRFQRLVDETSNW